MKIHLGAHIDGFASVTAETIVVGASPENPVTGRRADVLKAAHTAAEVAMRLVRVGNKNWAVTEAVNKVAATWGCKPVEGWSCDGHGLGFLGLFFIPRHAVVSARTKRYRWEEEDRAEPIRFQKREFDTVTFAEGEVWGVDILVSSGDDGKVRKSRRLTCA